jgi:MFS family permease
MEPTEKKPLVSPLLLTFIGTMILANIAGQMTYPFMPLYVQELGANVEQVGLFFTLGAIAPLLFQILGGWLSDATSRLQAIAIGSLGGVAAQLIYVFAPSWEWLLLATVGASIGFSFVGPAFQAFIAEQSTEETRGRVYGIMQTMFIIVGVIGPPVGGFLAQNLSYQEMLAVAAILYILAAIIRILMASRAGNDGEAKSGESRLSFANLKSSLTAMVGLLAAGGVVTWIFISDGIRDTSSSLTQQLTPLYVENVMGLSLVEIGLLTSVFSVAVMAFSSAGGWLSDRRGERVGIVGGYIIAVMGWGIFLIGRTSLHFAAAWALFGVGHAFIDPAYNSLISKVVPERLRGTAFGLFATSIGVISLPMPWIGARLWAALTPRAPFFIPPIALMLVLPIIWSRFKVPAGEPTDAEAPGD